MNEYYLKFNSRFLSSDAITSYMEENPQNWTTEKGYGFELMPIPPELIKDNWFKVLSRKFFIGTHLFKTKSKFFYQWHVDKTRSSSINIELISNHSHTVFSEEEDLFYN